MHGRKVYGHETKSIRSQKDRIIFIGRTHPTYEEDHKLSVRISIFLQAYYIKPGPYTL